MYAKISFRLTGNGDCEDPLYAYKIIMFCIAKILVCPVVLNNTCFRVCRQPLTIAVSSSTRRSSVMPLSSQPLSSLPQARGTSSPPMLSTTLASSPPIYAKFLKLSLFPSKSPPSCHSICRQGHDLGFGKPR